MPRKIHLTNFISVNIVSLMNMILPIVVILSLGRFYEVEEFGNYSVAAAFMNAMAVFLTFGLGNVISYEVAAVKSEDKTIISSILYSGILALLVFSAFGFSLVTILVVILKYSSDIVILICLLGLGYWSIGVNSVFNGVFMGLREMHYSAFSAVAVLVATFIIVIPTIFFHRPIWQIALSWSLCHGIGCITSIGLLIKKDLLIKPHIEKRQFTLILKRSLGVGFNNLINRFGANLTNILLPVYLSSYQIGVFNGAFKPFVLFAFASENALRFFSPYIARINNESMQKIEYYLAITHKVVAFFALTIMVLPVFFATPITKFIFGNKLIASSPYMSVLALGYMLFFLPPQTPPLMALGLEWKVIWCSLSRVIFNLLGIIILIPKYGIMGAVYAVNLAFFAYWFSTIICYWNENIKPIDNISRYLAFSIVSVMLAYFVKIWMSDQLCGIILFILLSCSISLIVYWSKHEKKIVLLYIKQLFK